MNNNTKMLVVSSAILLALGLVSTRVAAVNASSTDRLQLAMMDDDKMPMKPDASNSGNSNMSQPSGASQNMGGGRMNDDKMKMPGQMQDCQGSGCRQGVDMMQMMQTMHDRMNSSMGKAGGAAANADAVSGPADVTERLEGRIAFLKAELQITDRQLPDWNVVADALRSSRQHLLEARKQLVMDDKVPGTERVERYERHLTERLEAIKSARAAFNRLYASLNDGQKQTADAILLPLIATF
jgi:hypothetical protein